MSNIEFLDVAGVPVVIRLPANPSLPAPLIVLWHRFGVPNSEEMLAETLPLEKEPIKLVTVSIFQAKTPTQDLQYNCMIRQILPT